MSGLCPPQNALFSLSVEHEPKRLDVVLLARLQEKWPQLSRAALKEYFHQKRILYRRCPAAASMKLGPGTHEIEICDWQPEEEVQERKAAPSTRGCFLDIVYEDSGLLVLNKTSGTPSVPQSAQETETAVGAALAHAPEIASVGRGGFEPGILHRLDTGTSGLLAFAKTQSEFERLQSAWNSGGVRKEYRALVRRREPSQLAGTAERVPEKLSPRIMDSALAHDPKSTKKMILFERLPPSYRHATAEKGGAEKTGPEKAGAGHGRYKALPAWTQILEVKEVRDDFLDVHLEIRTGVMHQIRCHLGSLGWPILGDPVYRGVPSRRLWLHAWRLQLPRAAGAPADAPLVLEAPLPDGWPTA